jgi:hypothetical protein
LLWRNAEQTVDKQDSAPARSAIEANYLGTVSILSHLAPIFEGS